MLFRVAVLVSLLAASAQATPVKLEAIYEPISIGGKKIDPVPLSGGQLVLTNTANHRFKRVVAQIDTTLLQPNELRWVESFRIRVLVTSTVLRNAPSKDPLVAADVIIPIVGGVAPSGKQTVFTPDQLASESPFETIQIEITAKYRSEALCELERSLADEQQRKDGKREPDAKLDMPLRTVAQAGTLSPFDIVTAKDVPRVKDGRVILFTFCADLRTAVDWAAYVSSPHPSLSLGEFAPRVKNATPDREDTERSFRAHKLALFSMMKNRLPTLAFGQPPELVSAEPSESLSGTLVALREKFFLAVMKDPVSRITFREANIPLDSLEHREAVIDQDSELSVAYDSSDDTARALNGAGAFASLLTSLEVELEVLESNNAVVPKKVELGAQLSRSVPLKIMLKDYLDKEVILRAFVKLGEERVELTHSGKQTIRNLGLVTTFPLVSEIAGLVGKWSAKDQESSSTIPISWAVDLTRGDGRLVALTLPWIVGLNTRAAPQLSRYFALFGHVSLIMGPTGARPSIGVGAVVAQVFQISWGAELGAQTPSQFLLIGISVPTIAKLAQLP